MCRDQVLESRGMGGDTPRDSTRLGAARVLRPLKSDRVYECPMNTSCPETTSRLVHRLLDGSAAGVRDSSICSKTESRNMYVPSMERVVKFGKSAGHTALTNIASAASRPQRLSTGQPGTSPDIAAPRRALELLVQYAEREGRPERRNLAPRIAVQPSYRE
ncbi:hypothetical protein B0H17DRAFT_1145851 [Mycena rosella]|uniref:Uncharacterized protein n=1 Tax=Mycena rosella TaxID=1033263 RepID=A0AAD7CQV4_MYCRO|nr:hypothetical protein B0H17DRAFT_1145851 [Mycena rosella]